MTENKNQTDYYKLKVEDIFLPLNSSHTGLSQSQAEQRLEIYGINQIPKGHKETWYQALFRQFQSFLVYILIIAALISFFTPNHFFDGLVISFVVIANAIIGFFQEWRAEKALEKLQSLVQEKVQVQRQEGLDLLDVKELVPGDIIILEEGNKIPADCRIITAHNLQTQEAILTGESYPISKSTEALDGDLGIGDQKNMLWTGTLITQGQAQAIVVATAGRTQLGQIADSLNSAEEGPSDFQKKVRILSTQLGIFGISSSVLVFLIGLVRSNFDVNKLFDLFLVTIAVLVSAVPEGLPAVVAIVLAIGANRMSASKVIVRRLPATETLGAVGVICSDKTGTLTENSMTVKKLYTLDQEYQVEGSGYETKGNILLESETIDIRSHSKLEELISISLLASEGYLSDTGKLVGDPTEIAIDVVGKKTQLNRNQIKNQITEIDVLGFNSKNKFRASLWSKSQRQTLAVIGAAEVILEKSKFNSQKLKLAWIEKVKELSAQGFRVIATAKISDYKSSQIEVEEVDRLQFLGLIVIQDPLREEVKAAIKKAKIAGIRVIMLTGDHKDTAKSIALEAGLIDSEAGLVLEQSEIDKLSEAEFQEAVLKVNVYARLNPKTKLNITKILQGQGNLVAMTGDGVNDAPALKQADVGIAMGIVGSDVTRETADVVLTDDNFASIIDGVAQGRGVFNNLRLSTYYLLTSNFGETMTILTAMIIGFSSPLTASQILWMNLVTDGINGIALASEPVDPKLMTQKPVSAKENILNLQVIPYIALFTLIMVIGSLFAFNSLKSDIDQARTAVFAVMVFTQLFNLLSMRRLKSSILNKEFWSNKFVLIAFLSSFAVALATIYISPIANILSQKALPANVLLIIFLYSSCALWLAEIYKRLRYPKSNL